MNSRARAQPSDAPRAAFLDTSGWFAALSPREHGHQATTTIYRRWIEAGTDLVTTNLVVAEMQILLSRVRGSEFAVDFLDSLYQDPAHEVVFSDRDLERAAVDRWLRPFGDQRFSLADAVSFEVMRERKIRDALALDQHFTVAGFRIRP
ncbi:MAG: PIN domain-containing protein [Gemmatimonadota bacterium]|nr:PIN domain-containing protein [Gemmatimonadota bacterium]